MNKEYKRIQITLPLETYKMIAGKPNKSRFIAEAIENMFVVEQHDPIVDRLAQSLLGNEFFIEALKARIAPAKTDWGA